MITSAMFYKSEDNVERPQVLRLGPLSFSIQELFVSIITVIIVLPVNLLVLQLFRKTSDVPNCSRVKPYEESKELDSVMSVSRNSTPISNFSDSTQSTLGE